jgi:hypothetical protein
MRDARVRQIARLQKLAQPFLKRKHDENLEWMWTVYGAANHAAVLAFLIRYGNPRIDEPLSRACERCAYSAAWKDCCAEFESLRAPGSEYLGVQSPGPFRPHNMDSVKIIGAPLRHVIISTYSGADEKQKLEAALALAPPWLLWFTFADYTAKLLNLTIPDLSEAAGFMRSKADFDIWWGLPRGAFERAPWPHGSEHEPLARTDLNLLRPTIEDTIRPMTRRELMRKRAALQKSDRGERQEAWPPLIPVERLKLSRSERISLTLRNRDFHHASIGRPRPGSTTRFR